jgi:hypothetical protein
MLSESAFDSMSHEMKKGLSPQVHSGHFMKSAIRPLPGGVSSASVLVPWIVLTGKSASTKVSH